MAPNSRQCLGVAFVVLLFFVSEGQTCDPGEFATRNRCKNCPVGYYQNERNDFGDSCKSCLRGQYNPTIKQVACLPCTFGQYQDQTQQLACKSCLTKSYADETGLTICKDCQKGTYQDEVGYRICKACVAGKFGNQTKLPTCMECESGQYQGQVQQESCLPCEKGKFSDETGRQSCKNCLLKTYQDEEGQNICKNCVPGRFNSGDIVEGALCDECPKNHYENEEGQSECKKCEPGKANWVIGQIACESCPEGRYGDKPGSGCKGCDAGQYQSQKEQQSCTSCPAGWSRANSVLNNLWNECYRRYCNQYQSCKDACCNGNTCDTNGQTWGILEYFTNLPESDKLAQYQYDPLTCDRRQCAFCVAGQVQPDPEKLSCLECAAGKYQPEIKKDTCILCPTGFARTATEGATSCTQCLLGFYSDETTLSSCKSCPVGWKGTTDVGANWSTTPGTCVTCDAGKFAGPTGGQTSCKECEIGFFLPLANVGLLSECLVCIAATTTGSTDCKGCAAGEKGTSPSCTPCPKGRWAGGGDKSECTACPDGWHGRDIEGAEFCEECPIGQFSSGVSPRENVSTSCNLCPQGYYGQTLAALTQVSACIECNQGYWSNTEGSDHISNCKNCVPGKWSDTVHRTTDCEECEEGKYSGLPAATSRCTDCPEGYSQLESGKPSCTPCLPGEYQAATSMTTCNECEVGKFSNTVLQVQCNECPSGFYQPTTKSASCLPCMPGMSSQADGASICTECVSGKFIAAINSNASCTDCPAGQYVNKKSSSLCLDCPAGKYQNQDGQSICKDCPAQYFSEDEKSLLCVVCPLGYMQPSEKSVGCNVCGAGQEGIPGGCSNCDKGKYRVATAHGTPQTQCTACPIGWSQVAPGSASCIPCIPGTYQNEKGQESCLDCLADTKSAEVVKSIACVACEVGFYTDNMTASSRCLKCPVGTAGGGCQLCNPGKFRGSKNAATTCLSCPEGYYQEFRGSATCFRCFPGKFQSYQEKTMCDECNTNEYAPTSASLSCITCPKGFWTSNRNQSATCTECAPGKASLSGGNCVSCAPGQYRGPNDDASKCVDCPIGYSQGIDNSPACMKCFPGQYQEFLKQTSCKDCAVNTYSNDAASACTNCPLGFFTNKKTRSATCTDCPAGTAGLGCQDCDAGMYRGTLDDATVCLNCDAGQISAKKSQPFCLDCDVGTYQSEKGQATCNECAVGFYQAKKASTTKCKRCEKDGEVANEQKSGCIPRPEDPNAAIVTLEKIEVASKDGKRVRLTFRLTPSMRSTSPTTIEFGDRLELQVSPRADFKKDITFLLYNLDANKNKHSVELSFLVEPIQKSSGTIDNEYFEVTGIGSAWSQLRYYRAKVLKSGAAGRRGPTSTRNDAWVISENCGDDLYLRTHYDDLLTNKPLPLKQVTANDEVPSCMPCPLGANCRGPRTWAQVVSLPGYRPLPWDDRGYGKCPRPAACPGSDESLKPPAEQFDLDGGNSTRIARSCNGAHRGVLCGECNEYHDTKLGDNLGLCVVCPDEVQNYWRLSSLLVVGVIMMTFLVGDSLGGVSKIVHGVSKGSDVAVPFHSVGIRIISSYMQVAGLLNNFRLELPEAVTSLVTAQSAVSGVGGAVISFNCLFPTLRGSELFMIRLICVIVIIPAVAIVSVVIFWLLRAVCHKQKEPILSIHGHEFKHPGPKDKMIGTLVVLFYLMFPSILSGITTAMSCTTYGPKGSEVSRVLLDATLTIQCYKLVHITMLITVLLPSFAVFAILMPAAVVLAMRSHYKSQTLLPHQKDFDPTACYRYGFLFLGYEQEMYGWEVLVMMRKASFVVTSGLLRPYGPVAQVVGASIILIFSLSLHLQLSPYDSKGHDRMESYSLHCGILILMFVLLSSIVGRDISGKLGPISTVVLIIIFFSTTIFFFATAVKEIFSHSHDHPIIGILARRTTSRASVDRRHSSSRILGKAVKTKNGMSLQKVTPTSFLPDAKAEKAEEMKQETEAVTPREEKMEVKDEEKVASQELQKTIDRRKSRRMDRKNSIHGQRTIKNTII